MADYRYILVIFWPFLIFLYVYKDMNKIILPFWWIFYAIVAVLCLIKFGLIKIMRQRLPNFVQSRNKISSYMEEHCASAN